jgi:probable rRNA maturation factor
MKKMVHRACKLCGLLDGNSTFRIAINFVDIGTICRLNREFVRHEGPTDVISFNYGKDSSNDIDAELFICTDVAETTAKRLKRRFSDEVALYVIHGILHVSGEEDTTPSQKRRMRSLEKEMISELIKRFDFGEIFPSSRK